MKRRNRESRARIKLIQEMHFDKEEQASIDSDLARLKKRYTTAYADYHSGLCFFYDMVIGLKRGSRACAKAGVSVSQVTEAILNLAEAAKAAINT